MRIGIVSYWFNRGQATVARHLRSALDELGHETFVLARPTKESFVRPSFVAVDDVWRQDRVTVASSFMIPESEYLDFVLSNQLDAVFFDQNYQFDAIAKIRRLGVITIGRFVWEAFSERHADGAKDAMSVIYSLTRCEQERYRQMGIDSPYVPWGCHPELLAYRTTCQNEGSSFLYVGGYMSNRKPLGAVVQAFKAHRSPSSRLIIKAQSELRSANLVLPKVFSDLRGHAGVARADPTGDPRISIVINDMSQAEYYRMFSGADVSLAPSRWEGLGLHLYEAIAFGVPTISCDIPPINEVITDGVDGILVRCHALGPRPASGLMAYEPDVDDLRRAIDRLSDPVAAREMAENTRLALEKWAWRHTVSGISELIRYAH